MNFRYSKVAIRYWMKRLYRHLLEIADVAFSPRKQKKIRGEKAIYKVMEHHQYSTKWQHMDIYTKNKTVKTRVCFFVIYYIVTWQNGLRKKKTATYNNIIWGVQAFHCQLQYTFWCTFVRNIIISHSIQTSWQHSVGNHEKINEVFNLLSFSLMSTVCFSY